jgi:hypothetical protein
MHSDHSRSFSPRSLALLTPLSPLMPALGLCCRGDEGKGKLVDILAKRYDVIARFNGGANAGHTLVVGEGAAKKKFAFHLLPCGMLYPGKINVIGNGQCACACIHRLHTYTFLDISLSPSTLHPSIEFCVAEASQRMRLDTWVVVVVVVVQVWCWA